MAINSEKNWMKNKLTLSKVKKIYKFLDNHRRGKVGAKALFFFYQGIADRIFTEIRENFDIGS